MKFTLFYTLKCAIGAALAIYISDLLKLENLVTAGVIVILSIQNTKKDSIIIATKRLLAFIIAFILAPIILIPLNYSIFSFFVFLAAFIPIASYFKFQDGIVVNTVLVTHLLISQNITGVLIINEALIMIIGVVIALLANLYMPNIEKEILMNEEEIESLMASIINGMANSLRYQVNQIYEDKHFVQLKQLLKQSKKNAYQLAKNSLINKEDYHLEYINMRFQQYDILVGMRHHVKQYSVSYEVTGYIADFTEKLSQSISVTNKATPLLIQLTEMKTKFKTLALPKTREEFEDRALLFQFMSDLEQFLRVKEVFHNKKIMNTP